MTDIQALPELKDLRQKNAGQPLVIVSVSVDESKKTVQEFASRNGMPRERSSSRAWSSLSVEQTTVMSMPCVC